MLFEIDARQMERAFIRTLEKKGGFKTAQGRSNIYLGRTRSAILFKTNQGVKSLVIYRTKLRQAIQYAFYTRIVIRKDLERFSRFSSALLGILQVIFDGMAKLVKTSTGLLRLMLLGLRYFFAGVDRAVRDLEIAAISGAKFVLMSYAHIRKRKAWRKHVLRLGLKILLDSGAFTVWKSIQSGKTVDPILVKDYGDFIERNLDVLYAWFNLDVVGDAEASKKNAEYLNDRGLPCIEVWHIQNDLKELEKLVAKDLPVIAIGGSVGVGEPIREAVFQQVFSRFPNQAFHFLGGSGRLLFTFPWFSADGTGWLAGRKYGVIMHRNGQRKAPSDWNAEQCLMYNVQHFLDLERKDVSPELLLY